MSTKIFDGYKVKAKTLDKAIEIIFNGKDELKENYEYEFFKKQLRKAILTMDCYLVNQFNLMKNYLKISHSSLDDPIADKMSAENLNKELHNENPSSKAYIEDLDRALEKDPKKKIPDIEIVIFPKKVTVNGEAHYLCRLWTDNENEKIVQKVYANRLSEYVYYNNSDQPEEISDEEWEEREKNWDIAIPNDYASSDGLINKLVAGETVPYNDDMRSLVYEECCKEFSSDEYYQKRMDIFTKEAMKKVLFDENDLKKYVTKNSSKIGYFMDLMERVNNRKFTPEQQEKYELIQKILPAMLPQELDSKLLSTKLKDIYEERKSFIVSSKLENNLSIKPKSKKVKV